MQEIVKTNEELTAEMLAEVPDEYQKTVGFFIWDLLRAIAIVMVKLWERIAYVVGLFDIKNMEYDDLVKFVLQRRGIVARTESYAGGNMTVITGEGTITEGDLFETPDGLQFQAIETKEVGENDTFRVECLTPGPDGNVPIGSINVIPKTITGIVKVSNQEAMTGGYEKESKESIIERYLEDLQNPITSGNIYHYKKWAKEVTGVGEADVKPLWNGDNTVKVLIINSNMEQADSSLIKAVQDYIDPYTEGDNGEKIGWGCGLGQAPIGAYCTVESGKALNLSITFKGKLKTGATKELAEQAAAESIKNYLHEIAFDDSVTYVSYARIGSCIFNSDGIADYQELLVNGDTDNIPILNSTTDREVAVLQALSLEVVND